MVKIGRDINEYAFYSLYILTAPNLIELDSYDYLRMGPFITCNLLILSHASTYKGFYIFGQKSRFPSGKKTKSSLGYPRASKKERMSS